MFKGGESCLKDNMNNSNVSANILKKMLIEPYNEGKVNHFPLSHCKEYDRFTAVPIMGGGGGGGGR